MKRTVILHDALEASVEVHVVACIVYPSPLVALLNVMVSVLELFKVMILSL